ncbi:MAG: hypothetical protein ACI4SG_03320 [Oligosphaeraceae bacterium]
MSLFRHIPGPLLCLCLCLALPAFSQEAAAPAVVPPSRERLHDPFFQERQGLSCLRRGEVLLGLLHLRRASLAAPGSRRISRELALVRENFPQARRQDASSRRLPLPWQPTYPQWCAVSLCLWGVLCLCLLTLLWKRPRPLVRLTLLLALATLAAGARTLRFAWNLHHQTPAVVQSESILPRKGPGETFAPADASPLAQGSEVTLLFVQGKWSRVILPDHSPAWLPAESLLF